MGINEEILFAVKKENLETGLRGIPVGYCTTSAVYPDKGLYYGDFPIAELSSWEPERVIFLLYHGYCGTDEEIASFKKDLISRSQVSDESVHYIRNLPKKAHPMALLSAALLILGAFEATDDYQEDCLNLIAKIPQIAAEVINHHASWGKTPLSRPELGYMENFAQMLQAPDVDAEFPKILKLFNILHYDHDGGNLSTFVGKAVASGLEDLYGSLAAAMNALAGPLHGRANQECLEFVTAMQKQAGGKVTIETVERLIRQKLEKKELIYGFGHAVLRIEDPRATVLYAYAQKCYPEHPLVKMALMLRQAGSKVLKENPKVADPFPNVDAISGVLLSAAHFHYSEYYTVLFGLARVVGIAIQIVYERIFARDGKGTPIVRPLYIYKPRHTPSS